MTDRMTGGRVRRRRMAQVVAVLGAAAMVVTACSGSGGNENSGESSGSNQQSQGSGGVLRIAQDLSGRSTGLPTFDPSKARAGGANIPWQLPVYDSLLHYTTDGDLVPGLAKAAKVVDPSTVSVTLRPGLQFSDGTPLTADVVKTSILRNKAATQQGQFSRVLQDVESIEVGSPTSLTIQLSRPEAGAFYALLAGPETFVWPKSVTDADKHPIGAGPFKLEQFEQQQKIVLVKNPKYWDAKNIQLSKIEFINVAAGPQQVNAIRSNQVDVTTVQVSDLKALQNDSSVNLATATPEHSMLWMPLCKTYEPLSKVKVRQALSYAINRDAINAALLHGEGEPAWAMYPSDAPEFPEELNGRYAYDPKKARQLLADAGYPNGFDLNLILLPGNPAVAQTAQIVQADWKKVGVHLTLSNTTDYVSDLYLKHKGQTAVNPVLNPGLAKLDTLTKGNVGDLCNYDDPELNKLTTKLYGMAPDDPQATQLWKQIQTYISDRALSIYLDFIPVALASDPKVEDLNLVSSYLIAIPDYHTVHVSS